MSDTIRLYWHPIKEPLTQSGSRAGFVVGKQYTYPNCHRVSHSARNPARRTKRRKIHRGRNLRLVHRG
ncbi:predicted protein [Pyrenophora tritici-repentis Pt-1C-BFP]|uniref:Uncharacterized protein n=1 Tax=Pyrenophora tritici-repentis (strain Pt-1C-BFP) TaxID=426418 RepID=B2VX13_PYRTR|nr:uncharacterized protein PTRG_00250 [Pyrenophora tritici-repentis Pt-1C-BFP]EDU39688.1 predicted protein [Pyrenophora tritici-repentis Pt-1C-BFP]